jgi:hypothetical protein
MHLSRSRDQANGGPVLPKRARTDQSEPDQEQVGNLLRLRNVARTQRWVLEGTYYADTGEAPAETAVFASFPESQACSELLHHQIEDRSAVKKMWQGLTASDINLFVDDASHALQALRDKARELKAES